MINKNEHIATLNFKGESKDIKVFSTKFNDTPTKNFIGLDLDKFYYFDINKLPNFSANKNKSLVDKTTNILSEMTSSDFLNFMGQINNKESYKIQTKELVDKFIKAENYDIVALLEQFGFFINLKSSPKNAINLIDNKNAKNVVFKHKYSDEILLCHCVNNAFYFKNNYNTFNGNVYNLVNFYQFKNSDFKNPALFVQAHEFLKNFTGQDIKRSEIVAENRGEVKSSTAEAKVTKKSYPLRFPIYLVSRGILPSTLNNPTIFNTIYNTYPENNPYFMNISFLLKNNDFKNISYIEKNKDYQSFKEDVSTTGLLYLNNFKNPKALVFSETPIDLLSYAQDNNMISENVILASSAGNVNPEQINFLIKLIEENNIKIVDLCNDNDIAGHRFDYNIMYHIAKHYDVLNDIAHVYHELYCSDTRNISIPLYKKFCDNLFEVLKPHIFIQVQKTEQKDYNQYLCEKLNLTQKNQINTNNTPVLSALITKEIKGELLDFLNSSKNNQKKNFKLNR